MVAICRISAERVKPHKSGEPEESDLSYIRQVSSREEQECTIVQVEEDSKMRLDVANRKTIMKPYGPYCPMTNEQFKTWRENDNIRQGLPPDYDEPDEEEEVA